METCDCKCIVSFKDYPWCLTQDLHDVFDLRFLFEDEEILEMKKQLIEDSDKYFWYTYDDDCEENNEENNEDFNDNAIINRVEEIEEENWDDDEWDVRFDMRLGFIMDGYDSGYDEPNSRRQKYPEEDID